jgi:hypothetical protein
MLRTVESAFGQRSAGAVTEIAEAWVEALRTLGQVGVAAEAHAADQPLKLAPALLPIVAFESAGQGALGDEKHRRQRQQSGSGE